MGSDGVPEWAWEEARQQLCERAPDHHEPQCPMWRAPDAVKRVAHALTEADRRAYERGQHEERTRVLEWCDTLDGGPADGYTITLVEHAVGEGEWPHGDTEGGGDG